MARHHTSWNVFVVSGEGTDTDPRRRELLTTVSISNEVEDQETEARFQGEQFLGDGHEKFSGFKRLSVSRVE